LRLLNTPCQNLAPRRDT